MKVAAIGLLAWVVCATTCFAAPGSPDTPIGHVTLPKGKYVLTNTDNGSTILLNIDEHGIVRGHKQAVTSSTPALTAPAISTTAVNPTMPATVPQAANTAGAGAVSATSSKAISDKLKREAQRAIRRGDVQKLIKKVGL